MAQRHLPVRKGAPGRQPPVTNIFQYRFNDAQCLHDADEAIARYQANIDCLQRYALLFSLCLHTTQTTTSVPSIMDGQPAEIDTAPVEAARQRAAQLWRAAAGEVPPPAVLEGSGGDVASGHAAVAALRAELQEPPVVASMPRLTPLYSLHDAAKLNALARGRPVPAHVTAQAQEPGTSVRARLMAPAGKVDRGEAVAVSEEHWAAVRASLPTSTVHSLD